MKFVIVLAFVAVASALTPPHITGTTPPPVYCPNQLCDGKFDGNFKYIDSYTYEVNPHYFLQCSNGLAYCQACWPLHLTFVQRCNQCLYSAHDECVTTKTWYPATTYYCPDKCPHRGPRFSGNINDPSNPGQYVACWKGVTVGCVACPKGLEFNEKWNACLFEGKYKTEPNSYKPHVIQTTSTTTTTKKPNNPRSTTTTTKKPTTTSTTKKPTTTASTTTTTTTTKKPTTTTTSTTTSTTTTTTTTKKPTTTTTSTTTTTTKKPTTKRGYYHGLI